MSNKVVFNLKRFWEMDDGSILELYPAIKTLEKTSEWRDATNYWFKRLFPKMNAFQIIAVLPPEESIEEGMRIDLTEFLVPKIAWFVVGYPKNNSPRLETDITKVLYWPHKDRMSQLEIQFNNVKEIKVASL